MTKGTIDLSWPIHVDFTCKIIYTWYMIAEQLSSFTLLLFSIERFIVVYFPLRAKAIVSFRRTLITTGAVLLAIALFSTHLYFSIHSIPLRLNTYCAVSGVLSGPVLAALYWFSMGVESYLVPTYVSIALNMSILVRILSARSMRYAMSVASRNSASAATGESSNAVRERRATMSLVFISIAHTVIYTPSIIVSGYLALTFLELIPIPAVLDVNILVEFSWVSVHMTNIGKVRLPYYCKIFNYCILVLRKKIKPQLLFLKFAEIFISL